MIFKGKVRITSPYGYRELNGKQEFHAGIDLVGEEDKTIYAPIGGTVGFSGIITDKSNKTWEWGNYVRLDTPNYKHYFCHCSKLLVKAGQNVNKGDAIAVMGNTGYSFGAHCHYEIRKVKDNEAVNPSVFLRIKNVVGNVTAGKKGIDVSKHQGKIDWGKVKSSDVEFAMIRAGYSWYEGGITEDERFKYNIENALKNKIPVGIYVYAYDKTAGAAEKSAETAVKMLKSYDISLPVVYDIEDSQYSRFDKAELTDIVNAFCRTVENSGYRAWWYTYTSFANTRLNPSKIDYPLWIADYRDYCGYTGDYAMWQYTSKGSVKGIGGRVDLNLMFDTGLKKGDEVKPKWKWYIQSIEGDTAVVASKTGKCRFRCRVENLRKAEEN